MKRVGQKWVLGSAAILFTFFFSSEPLLATVKMDIKQTLVMDSDPLDVAVSPDWNKLFILTQTGEILIYSAGSMQPDRIKVGLHIDQIEAGPQGEVLILRSASRKQVQVMSLSFVKDIDISGAPYLGTETAPITVAVFSDFE